MSWQLSGSMSADLAVGSGWTTRKAGGWHQGFWKRVADSAALTQDFVSFKYWSNGTALLSQTTKVGIRRQRKQIKGQDLKPGFKVSAAPAWEADRCRASRRCIQVCMRSFWNPSCSLDEEALQGLLVKPVYSNLLVSAVGTGRLWKQEVKHILLKESFCDQAKTRGVILDSSNSFMPHFQTVSKSCKSYFENVSSIWLLLNNSTAMTLGHAPVIPHQLICRGSSPHSGLLLSPPQSSLSPVARVILFSCHSIFYLVIVLFLLIVNSSLQSRVT